MKKFYNNLNTFGKYSISTIIFALVYFLVYFLVDYSKSTKVATKDPNLKDYVCIYNITYVDLSGTTHGARFDTYCSDSIRLAYKDTKSFEGNENNYVLLAGSRVIFTNIYEFNITGKKLIRILK